MNKTEFRHNDGELRFELLLDKATAFLYYQVYGPETWILTHTLVPDPLKGKGLGSQLVAQALEYCRAHKIRVIPECSFVDAFFRKNPEWADLLHTPLE